MGEPALCRAIVTFNTPEPDHALRLRERAWPFDVLVLENSVPAGFGANHNHAFEVDRTQGGGDVLAVVNPDVRLSGNPFPALLRALARDPRAALAYPRQLDAQGAPQDSERLVPTPVRLLRRQVLRQRFELAPGRAPEWVNAAFLLLRRAAFDAVGGFDARYRLYCEDVDLCLRLQLAGWTLAVAPGAVVEHGAERASHRNVQAFAWHLQSLWRLWRSPTWRDWQVLQRARGRRYPP